MTPADLGLARGAEGAVSATLCERDKSDGRSKKRRLLIRAYTASPLE